VFATHDLKWVARVGTATSNPYDGSATLFGAFSGWYGVGVEREQMVMFEDDHVTWGDQSQQYLLDGHLWHSYRLRVLAGGGAELYVDGVLALSRPTFVTGAAIGFGDQTNDWTYEGSFEIKSLILTPGPACP